MKKLSILFILLVSLYSLFSAELEYKVDKPTTLHLGTPFSILVDIITEKGENIIAPAGDTLDIFIKQDVTQFEEETEDGKTLTHVDLKYAAWNTGTAEFPALEFSVIGDTTQKLSTQAFTVVIESILSDSVRAELKQATDIDTSKFKVFHSAAVRINPTPFEIAFPIILLILIALIVILAVRLVKKYIAKRNAPEERTIADNRPAHVIALEMLESLKGRKLLQTNQLIEYHYQLSMILRIYVELAYGIKAVEMTTSEIRANLVLEDFQEKSWILGFLNEADKVKFAKFTPEYSVSEQAMSSLNEYLKTKETEYNRKQRQEEQNV